MQMRAFVVTSAGIAEGKTLTALNLAWLLAQTEGVRALVIDSDLRRPAPLIISASMHQSDSRKFSAVNCDLEDAIVRLDPAGLHLLPGGQTARRRRRVAFRTKLRACADGSATHV